MSSRAGVPGAWVGYALVAAAATSWGAQSVVAKLLLTRVAGGLDPASLVSARTTLSALIMTVALGAINPGLLRVRPGDVGRLALLGIIGMALSNYAYYVALQRIPVATAALLIYTAPLLVLAADVLLYRQPVRRRDLVGAIVTLGGAALVVRAYEPSALVGNLGGIAAGTFTAVAFAFYNLWGQRIAPRLSPWTTVTYTLAIGAVFWLPLAPPWTVLLASHPPLTWAGLGVVVVFGTLAPAALYLAGLARISAAHASVTSTLEPAVAAAVAFLVLGERLEWPQLVGGALILAGIASLHAR